MPDNRRHLKDTLTHKMVEWHNAAQEAEPMRETFETGYLRFWRNYRPEGGLRLSNEGYNLMRINHVQEYRFGINLETFTNQALIRLDTKMKTPYYIVLKLGKTVTPETLCLFGSEEAMLLTLHGDLNRFLEML